MLAALTHTHFIYPVQEHLGTSMLLNSLAMRTAGRAGKDELLFKFLFHYLLDELI